MDKYALGWPRVGYHYVFDEQSKTEDEHQLVRISARFKTSYHALTTSGELVNCHLPGKMLHSVFAGSELPAVGDWCVVGERFLDQSNEQAAQICEVLPRRSKIARMGCGTDGGEQILAANVDVVFIVTSASRDFNINRLRRFVLLATHGNAKPVIILSKVDLLSGSEEHALGDSLVDEIKNEFHGIEVIATSSHDMFGIDAVSDKLTAGVTAIFVGSSGVGKSTLVNILIGKDVQTTKEIRHDVQKGRHTTSASQLFFMPSGGIIIDTPGLREVGLIADEVDLEVLVPSINQFASQCKFRNCSHASEPDCAVQGALDGGELPQEELDVYVQMEREAAYNRRKLDSRLAQEERKRWKRITIQNRREKKADRW